jgi:protoporphyrin/coproporphyrin ferrochelatase
MGRGLLLIGHGTVEDLDDLAPFVTNIRRGRPPPRELLDELRHRYEAIGGSPLNEISTRLAQKLEARLGVPVRMSTRLWKPYPREVLDDLAAVGATHVAVVPLAQHSAAIYGAAAREAQKERESGGAPPISLACAANWGQTPELLDAYARSIEVALTKIPEASRGKTTLILSAHSLPKSIIDAGDPYESEFRKSAESIAARVAHAPTHVVAFQSQGMSDGPDGKPMTWLGPTLEATLDRVRERGDTHVVFAPVGFLADHIEILYDLDIEATAWSAARGLTAVRTPSLNAGEGIIEAIAAVARPLLDRAAA